MRGTHTYTHNQFRFQFRVRFLPQQSIRYSFFWHSSNMSTPTTGEGILRILSLDLSLVIYFYYLSFVRLCIEGIEKVLEKTPSGVFRRRVFFFQIEPYFLENLSALDRLKNQLLLDRSPFFKACPKREGTPYFSENSEAQRMGWLLPPAAGERGSVMTIRPRRERFGPRRSIHAYWLRTITVFRAQTKGLACR
jgi:hypothetical protein